MIITSVLRVISGVVVVDAPSTLNNSPAVQRDEAGGWVGGVTVGWSIDPHGGVKKRVFECDVRMTVSRTFVVEVCEQVATIPVGDLKPIECSREHTYGLLCSDVGCIDYSENGKQGKVNEEASESLYHFLLHV